MLHYFREHIGQAAALVGILVGLASKYGYDFRYQCREDWRGIKRLLTRVER